MHPIKQRCAIRAALSAVLAAGVACAAQAADPAYYVGIQGGTNNLKHLPATVSLGPGVSLPGHLVLDGDTQFGVVAGRQTENARFELEYQTGDFDITAIRLGPISQNVSNSGRYRALTLNAYRTQPIRGNWTGYAGLGIGWGKASLPQMGFTGGCNCFAAASESGLAYQGRAGLEYALDRRHNAFVQYTLLRLPKQASGGTPGTSYERRSVGIIGVGYRFGF